MTGIVSLINSNPADNLTVADRGLHYGDGLFETLAIRAGQPRRWNAHLQRLGAGLQRLGFPDIDAAALSQDVVQLCAGVERGVLKIIVTRGSGGRGYRPPAPAVPTRIVQRHPWPDYPQAWLRQGVLLRLCRTRLSIQPALAGLKHLNRLEQVLARSEWADPHIAEGLMLDTADRVISGTMSNVFFVSDGILHTPDVGRCGVAGVTRHTILDLARQRGWPTRMGDFVVQDLLQAQEIFLCNSVIGVWPVISLDGYALAQGELTRLIAAALEA